SWRSVRRTPMSWRRPSGRLGCGHRFASGAARPIPRSGGSTVVDSRPLAGSTTGDERLAGNLLDLAGPDAGRADVDAARAAVDERPDPLDVGVPPALGAPVGVADAHSEGRVLAAHLAYRCHETSLSVRGRCRCAPPIGCPTRERCETTPEG